jgi:hypothetical protein
MKFWKEGSFAAKMMAVSLVGVLLSIGLCSQGHLYLGEDGGRQGGDFFLRSGFILFLSSVVGIIVSFILFALREW